SVVQQEGLSARIGSFFGVFSRNTQGFVGLELRKRDTRRGGRVHKGDAMRLATIETWAGPRAAVQVGDGFVNVHALDAQFPPTVRQLLEGGPALLQAAAEAARRPG